MKRILKKYKELSPAVKASLWFTICSILQKGISFITVPIFTRILSTEEYGIYSLFLSWQGIVCVFATLNLSYQVFNNGMIKYENDRYGYTTAMLGLSNLCTIILFVVYLLFSDIFNKISGLDFFQVFLMFIGFIFSSATSLWTVHQRFLFKYKALCFVTILTSFGSALLGIVFLKFNNSGNSRILADTLVVTVIGILIYIFILSKNHKLINVKYWKYALALDLPLIAHYLSMSVLGSADRIMINSMCGTEYTALYSVPFNASMIMQIIINSINASFIPWTYQKCQNNDWKSLNNLSTILILFVGVITLLPSLFAPELVWILGSNRYAMSVWIVPPVSCSVFFIFLYSLFSNIELYYENSKNIMKASILTSILNLILNFVFIKFFGYVAAAYTTLVCYIFLSLLHYIYMKKVLKEENVKEHPYNLEAILIISFIIIGYSILITFTYSKSWILRYTIILFIFVLFYFNRKIFIEKFKIIKSK